VNIQFCIEYSQITNQILHSFLHSKVHSIGDKCQLAIAHSVFKQSVLNVHQLQQHTMDQSLLQNATIALISMSSCSKSFHIINKAVFQLGNVGQL